MARRRLASILQQVQANVGFHSQWVGQAGSGLAVAPDQAIVSAAAREITEAFHWSYRKRVTFLQTVAPYSAGTVTLVQGSSVVQGAGTAWTAAMVGSAIKLPDPQYLYVQAVTGPTTLVLGDPNGTVFPWGGASASGQVYKIFQVQYALPDDLDIILLPTRDWPVYAAPVELLDRLDPNRTSGGVPDRYALSFQTQNAGIEKRFIEFWPFPDNVYTMRFPYLRRCQDPLNLNDIPLFPSELLEMLGTARAMRYLHTKTGDQRWLDQSKEWKTDFQAKYMDCVQEDIDRFGVPEAISSGEVQIGYDQLGSRDWDLQN